MMVIYQVFLDKRMVVDQKIWPTIDAMLLVPLTPAAPFRAADRGVAEWRWPWLGYGGPLVGSEALTNASVIDSLSVMMLDRCETSTPQAVEAPPFPRFWPQGDVNSWWSHTVKPCSGTTWEVWFLYASTISARSSAICRVNPWNTADPAAPLGETAGWEWLQHWIPMQGITCADLHDLFWMELCVDMPREYVP